MSWSERLSSIAELVTGGEPDPDGYVTASTELYTTGHDVSRPDNDIPDYWNVYNTNPLISQPIDTLANDVVEPGWYFEADSEDTVEELTEYAEQVAMVENSNRRNITSLLHSNIVTHQVTGTVFVEDVTDDEDRPTALQPLQTETIEIYTKPDSSVLVAPDDTQYDGIHITEEGDAAAYVQFRTGISKWSDREERRFTRDEILQWNRGSQPGAQYGVGRVQRVFERALAVESKLRDNDDAIAMKAWPGIIFEFGTEEEPWDREEMDDFLEDFEGPKFGPGMMKGVSGDVSVTEFAGETADIEGSVATDVNYITSGLPGPKHGLGSFTDGVKDSLAAVQQRRYRKLKRFLRNELENLYTPYFRDVAEAYNLDSPDSVQFHVGRPQGEVDPEQVSGNVIRYTSDVSADAGAQEGDGGGDGEPAVGDNPNEAPEGESVPDMSVLASFDPIPGDATSAGDEHSHEYADGVAELADPRLTGTREIESAVADAVESVALDLRDLSIAVVEERFSDLESVPVRDYNDAVADRSRSLVNEATARSAIDDELRRVFDRVRDTLGQDSHAPPLTLAYDSRYDEIVRAAETDIRTDLRTVAEDIENVASMQLARSRMTGDDVEAWGERVRSEITEDRLAQRAQVIARMRIQQLINQCKLRAYRDADGVVGVTVINPCTPSTTTLCERLAGCGPRDSAEAYFDSRQSIGQQLQDHVNDDLLYVGFDPLGLPPFHYGCRSEFVPITDTNTE